MLTRHLWIASIVVVVLVSTNLLLVGLAHSQPGPAATSAPGAGRPASEVLMSHVTVSPSTGLAALYLQTNWRFGASYINGFAALSPTLFFAGYDGRGIELWKSDGSPAGTRLVKDINPGAPSSSPCLGLTTAFSQTMLFLATGDATSGLWKSDGTLAGTVFLGGPAADGSCRGTIVSAPGKVFFSVGEGLWKSDGTPAATLRLSNTSGESGLIMVNGLLLFTASTPATGQELWCSDGTPEGTRLIKDIRPGDIGSIPYMSSYVTQNQTVFFVADDGVHGRQLWRTDGTAAGTWQLTNEDAFNILYDGALVQDLLFFSLTQFNGGNNRIELWRSDGTVAGTFKLPGPSTPANFVNLNGQFLFSAESATVGRELWGSDGTVAGTQVFKDINPGSTSSSPADFKVIGRRLFFQADNSLTGMELWTSDGTVAGTQLVKDCHPGAVGQVPPLTMAEARGTAFFVADDGIHGPELWKSDGTTAGTQMLTTLDAVEINLLNPYYKALFFLATAGNQAQIGQTDGTPTGTVSLETVTATVSSGSGQPRWFPSSFQAQDHHLFYSIYVSDTVGQLRVLPVNVTPDLNPDLYFLRSNETLTVEANAGVLANDTDPENDALTAVLVTPPTTGTLDLLATGALTYAPPVNFSGVVTFTYQVDDGWAAAGPETAEIIVGDYDQLYLPMIQK
jgi:ELWxxDGT repeat protein